MVEQYKMARLLRPLELVQLVNRVSWTEPVGPDKPLLENIFSLSFSFWNWKFSSSVAFTKRERFQYFLQNIHFRYTITLCGKYYFTMSQVRNWPNSITIGYAKPFVTGFRKRAWWRSKPGPDGWRRPSALLPSLDWDSNDSWSKSVRGNLVRMGTLTFSDLNYRPPINLFDLHLTWSTDMLNKFVYRG